MTPLSFLPPPPPHLTHPKDSEGFSGGLIPHHCVMFPPFFWYALTLVETVLSIHFFSGSQLILDICLWVLNYYWKFLIWVLSKWLFLWDLSSVSFCFLLFADSFKVGDSCRFGQDPGHLEMLLGKFWYFLTFFRQDSAISSDLRCSKVPHFMKMFLDWKKRGRVSTISSKWVLTKILSLFELSRISWWTALNRR